MPGNKPARGGKGPVLPKLLRCWWKKRESTQASGKTCHVLGLEASILLRWPHRKPSKHRSVLLTQLQTLFRSCPFFSVLNVLTSNHCPASRVSQVPSDWWQFSFFPHPARSWWKWRLCPKMWDYWLLSETEHFSEVMNIFLKSALLSWIQVSVCLSEAYSNHCSGAGSDGWRQSTHRWRRPALFHCHQTLRRRNPIKSQNRARSWRPWSAWWRSLTLRVELFIFAMKLRRHISMEPGVLDTVLVLY